MGEFPHITTNNVQYSCSLYGEFIFQCVDNSFTRIIQYLYSSLQVMAQSAAFFHRYRETSLSYTNAGVSRSIVRAYDGSNQELMMTENLSATTIWQVTYSAWDANGRPTTGTGTFTENMTTTCSGRTVSIAYNDTLRTRTVTASGGSGTNCTYGSMTLMQDAEKIATNNTQGHNFTANTTEQLCY